MLEGLQGLPKINSLRSYLGKLFKEKGEKIVSLILFGSMAKGEYTIYSDYDLLIVVSKEELDIKDRLYEYSKYSDGWVEPFVYTVKEIEEMFKDMNMLILEALNDGITLYDKNFWKNLKEKFKKLMKERVIVRKKHGWEISPQKSPQNSQKDSR